MERTNDVLRWYKANPNSNPNIFELMEVMGEDARFEDVEPEVINELVDLEIKRLFEKGIITDENDQLIALINEFRAKVLSGEMVSKNEETLNKMVGGVVFFIKTKEKETGQEYAYTNSDEYHKILSASQLVSQFDGPLSDVMQSNLEFIESRYKGYRRESGIAQEQRRIREEEIKAKIALEAEETAKKIKEQVDNFVYPERIPELMEYYKKNSVLIPADVLVKTLVGLGTDENFETVLGRITEANLADTARYFVVSAAARFAKNGPDFWLYERKSRGMEIDADDLAYAEEIRQENAKFEAKYNQPKPEGPQY